MTNTGLIVMLAVQAALAAGLLFIGSWGWEASQRSAPTHMSEEEQAHRAAVMRRGAGACYVVGFVLAASVVFGAADAWDLW